MNKLKNEVHYASDMRRNAVGELERLKNEIKR